MAFELDNVMHKIFYEVCTMEIMEMSWETMLLYGKPGNYRLVKMSGRKWTWDFTGF